ncbi:MAG: hypothetical protein HYZ86_03435 [Candidatus Omnitrophica bacterium]|nr:hypothetical protein [Candidatus Omnitrophota bacterium]
MRLGLIFALSLLSVVFAAGCVNGRTGNNNGQIQSYPYSVVEAQWIRNGEPIEYGGQKWFPVNDVEILMDPEVTVVGEYKGTQIFVDKIDTKPYDRLYTKFARDKFRYYERWPND